MDPTLLNLSIFIAVTLSYCASTSSVFPLVPDEKMPLTEEFNSTLQFRNFVLSTARIDCEEELIEETEYVVLQNGSLLLPQNKKLYHYDSYIVQNETVFICPEAQEETVESASHYNFSEEFLNCGHILVEPHEYKLLSNGTVYIDIYSKLYSPSDYYIQDEGVYVCIPVFSEMEGYTANMSNVTLEAKFSEAFTYVTYIGISTSIVSLILHLIVFCLVSKVRNLPGCCLASLSVSLLVAYLCFASSAAVESNSEECAHLGAAIYYFFLTSFFWMNAIAFDVWRSFRVVMRELRISSHRVPWRRFLLYSIYSWLIPGIFVCVACLSDISDFLPEEYRPSFGFPICWFGQRKALLIFFASPLCIIMLLNAIFFLDSSYVINKAALKTSQLDDGMMKRRCFMFMRLALIMGLTWIVGIIAGYANVVPLWYIFVILNTFQGLFIFIVFSCSSNVRSHFLGKMGSMDKSRQSTSVRTISQVSGAL